MQISENLRSSRGFSPAHKFTQTWQRFSPGYNGKENMIYFFYKIIFSLNKEKGDIPELQPQNKLERKLYHLQRERPRQKENSLKLSKLKDLFTTTTGHYTRIQISIIGKQSLRRYSTNNHNTLHLKKMSQRPLKHCKHSKKCIFEHPKKQPTTYNFWYLTYSNCKVKENLTNCLSSLWGVMHLSAASPWG